MTTVFSKGNNFLPQNNSLQITNISLFTENLIQRMKSGQYLTEKGNIYSDSAIRGYQSFYKHLIEFENLHDTEFLFTEITYGFAREFQNFITSKGLSKNSIAMVLAKFKAVMKEAWKEGIAYWNGSGLKCPTETTTQVYLTIPELKKLKSVELSHTEEMILDTFFIQCFTGLRFDTLRKFLANPLAYIHEHEGYTFIDITSDKTGEASLIPLGDTVKDILEKHNGTLVVFTEQYTNRILKKISQKAGITNQIVSRRTEGGEMHEKMISKHLKISTHTARRTLISLMKNNQFSNNEITLISGHTTEAQMLKYDRSGNFDKIKPLLGNSFFNTKI